MPITVIAGGQFGSEGKGKVSYELARKGVAAAVRVGGPNSGHTAIHEGTRFALQVLPTPALLPDGDVILPPGNYLEVGRLFEEIDQTGLDVARLHIDPNCVVVDAAAVESEHASEALRAIGSTQSGTGHAVAARIARAGATLASEVPDLKPFLTDTLMLQRSILRSRGRIIIEGTQGYGLSVLHSQSYPYVTSRDTTAAGFVSEAGLSPFDVDQVFLVLRAFPIRVAGPSGPLEREVSWEYVSEMAGIEGLEEMTTVTKKRRRVALFDPGIANRAIAANQPTEVVLNHVDYFDRVAAESGSLTARARRELHAINGSLDSPVTHFGLAPDHLDSFASGF
ncbi:MAG: hypothetical protein HKN91_09065 [Acidimicrobiia bacterium]|nr:hypothetical protein [Acidimicrobiia bacterium]